MKNFKFYNPTQIYFGKGEIDHLGTRIKAEAKKVLLVYGKTSIKRTGLYDKVIQQLQRESIVFYEVSGVDPNPRIESVRQGVELCKKHDIELVLGVGGGSVIDCSKAIALGAKYEGDPWDIYEYKVDPIDSLKVAGVLTLSATGTEMNGNSVISNMSINKKRGFGSILSYPVFSILDPELTYSVSPYQTACGVVDSLTHIYEFYFSNDQSFLNDRVCEAIMKTIIHYGPKAIQNPKDFEARSNLMFSSTLALNGLTGFAKTWDGFNHTTEHVLSAYYDIAHGAGLAITGANWMDYILDNDNVDKFYNFAVNVWDVEENADKMNVAKQGIQAMKEFYKSINMPLTLKEENIINPDLDLLSKEAMRADTIGRFKELSQEDLKQILYNAL